MAMALTVAPARLPAQSNETDAIDVRFVEDCTERMEVANPTTTQTLDIKFFENPDAQADKNGIESSKDSGASARSTRQPREQSKNYHS